MNREYLIDETLEDVDQEFLDHARSIKRVTFEVFNERLRQDTKWGGPEHDDEHSTQEFCKWIKNYTGWADQMADCHSWDQARDRLIQVAALAVAAVESIDRKTN